MFATNRNINNTRCTAKSCRRSSDAQSQNGVVTVLLPFLPIKAANRLVRHNRDQITVELPHLQNYKSLTLRWHSFQCIVHSISAAIDNSFHDDFELVGSLSDRLRLGPVAKPSAVTFLHCSLSHDQNLCILPKASLRLQYICLSTNIHKLVFTICP